MPAADESSIAEPPPADEELSSFSLEFEIVEDSTKRRRNKLVDNRGFELQTEHIPDDFLRKDLKVSKIDCLLTKYD